MIRYAPRRCLSSRPRRLRLRRGAGLAEILLAIVIFSLVATSYAAVSLRYSTRMKTISAGAARSAALAEHLNRLMAEKFDSLITDTGTVVVSTGSFRHTRRITVTGTGTTRTVTLILTPTNTAIKPDTVIMTRVKASTSSPLG